MAPANGSRALAQRFWLLSRRILRHANQGVPRLEFMGEMSRLVLEFSGCDGLEVRLWGPELSFRWQAWSDGRTELENYPAPAGPEVACRFPRHPALKRICRQVACHRQPPVEAPCFTASTGAPAALHPRLADLQSGRR